MRFRLAIFAFVIRPTWWCAAALLLVVLVSWTLSYGRRHGVSYNAWHRYALTADQGDLEFEFGTHTNLVASADGVARIVPVSYTEPDIVFPTQGGRRAEFEWATPIPRVKHEGLTRMHSFTRLSGGSMPQVRAVDGEAVTIEYVNFGRSVDVYVFPIWWLAASLGAFVLVAGGALARFMRNRRATRRRLAGLCPGCGYDQRATPEFCPECGDVGTLTPAPSSAVVTSEAPRSAALSTPTR